MARTMSTSNMSLHRWWRLQYFSMFVLLLVIGNQIIDGQSNIKTTFSCQGRPSGYYADVESGCQIYHMCDGLGRQFSYSCPNTTLFQQRMLICDHWYMVNCNKSEGDYTANLLIGQREKPFVEDSEDHPYYRTPRPDLLAHPSASEYNIIYRIGRAQVGSNHNLVGADSNEDGEKNDGPAYFLPSHWSTEYRKGSKPLRNSQKVNLSQQSQEEFKTGFANDAFNEIKSNNAFKRVDSDISKTIPVNFVTTTTSVYPKLELPEFPLANKELTNVGTGNVHTVVLSPAIQTSQNSRNRINNRQNSRVNNPENFRPSNFRQSVDSVSAVNFKSTFKATSPIYPVTLDDETIAKNNFDFGELTIGNGEISDDILDDPIGNQKGHVDESSSVVINFISDFKATTPTYPTSLDEETKLKNEYDFGQLLPLNRNDHNKPMVNFQSNFKATTPVYPNYVDPALARKHNADFAGETPKLDEEETPILVNFKSNFQATTPVYPKDVDPSVHLAGGGSFIGAAEGIAETIVPPRVNNNPSQPSISFGFTRFTGASENQESQSEALLISKAPNTESQWQELRTMFLIPDYDFPLDTITRPAYESKGPNSFQAKHNTHT